MAHDPIQYPKTGVGVHQEEQIWRSPFMANTHIDAHKLRFLKNILDPIDCHRFIDDFCNKPDLTYDWYLYQWPGASGVEAPQCSDYANGILALATGGDDDDRGELTQMCECWKFAPCYPLYAETRLLLSAEAGGAARECDFWFGLVQGHQWFVLPANWAVIHKDDGDIDFEFGTSNGGVSTNLDNLYSPVDWNVWYRLGIHWDGCSTLRYFIIQDGDFPQTILATGTKTDNIPTTELSLGFGIQAGFAGTVVLVVDYIKCCQLRVKEMTSCEDGGRQ